MSVTRIIAKRLAALTLAGGMVLAGGVAWAQDTIRTRGWAHPDFGRLVFDWTRPVGYQAAVEGAVLVLRFDEPMASDFRSALSRLDGYLASADLSEDGRELRFPLKRSVTLKSFKNGNAVVVDLYPQAAPTSAPELPVRIDRQSNYTRFTFDWTTPVDYRVTEDGRTLSVKFDKAATVDRDAFARGLPTGFGDVHVLAGDKDVTIAFTMPDQSRIRHFKTGSRIVLDVLPDEAARQDTAATTTENTPEDSPSGMPQSGLLPPPEENDRPAASVSSETASPENMAPAETPAMKKAEEKPIASEEATDQPASEVAAEETAPVAETPPQEAPAQMAEERSAGDSNDVGPAPVSLVFQWPEEVGAAAFRRGSNIWILFDRRAPLDLAPLRQQGEPLIERIEQVQVPGSTVLRLRTMPGVNPTAKREGYDWVFDFRKGPIAPRHQIAIQAEADADVGPQLLFPVAEPGSIINLLDPDVGDTLRIATFKDPGYGIEGRRNYPEFALLPSAQGLVIQTLSDRVLFDRDLNGFELSSPDGLHISAVSPEAPASSGASLSAKRLFNLEEWARGELRDYYNAEQALFRTVTEIPAEKKTDARLDLAHFYVARGRGAEAVGVLETIETDDTTVAARPDFRALRGAAHYLNREYEEARRDFDDPRLDGFSEIAIWRGAVLAELDEWNGAAQAFQAGDSILRSYPYPLKGKLGLSRIEAALATRDLQSAERWLAELDRRPDQLRRGQLADLRYNQARVALTRDDIEGAEDIWRDLVRGDDWHNAVRAEYALVNLGLREQSLAVDKAIERLEKLRFKWRGDTFELRVLRRLGELHIDADDYMSGLGIMRTAVTYFPSNPEAQALAEEMVAIFRNLYLDGKADELPPLRALAIYDEFRELTPSGADGDLMVELLADRLIAVDLLNRAITLLDHQVKFRLTGEEKARVGAKLALIQLLDRKAGDAITTLNQTNFPQLPRDLEDDRRRLLAKAHFETGDKGEAIKLLAGDISKEADMLRRDIYWVDEDWAEVAKVLQRLAGDPPEDAIVGVPEEQARYVLNWAVALRLNNDEDGLALLNELYGKAMQYSALASTYNFIATPVENGFSAKLQDTIQQLASSELFNAFLNNYRDKMLKNQGPTG